MMMKRAMVCAAPVAALFSPALCESGNPRLPSHFRANVLVGGAPALQFKGVRATLNVSGGAWRLDIPVPPQPGVAHDLKATVLCDAQGARYRWISDSEGNCMPIE